MVTKLSEWSIAKETGQSPVFALFLALKSDIFKE